MNSHLLKSRNPDHNLKTKQYSNKSTTQKSKKMTDLADEIPTKDLNTHDHMKVSKITTPQGQDEISVTIDMGQDDMGQPIVGGGGQHGQQRRRKPQQTPDSHHGNRHKSPVTMGDHKDNPKYKSQSNISMDQAIDDNDSDKLTAQVPVNPVDFNEKLSVWMSDHVYYPSIVSQSEQVSARLRNIATDTFELDRRHDEEIRLLHETIDDLECQSKIKEREIETNKWIEKEMQRRLQSAGDFFGLKNQLKELQRNLDVHERLNQDLTNDNSRLYDEIGNKDRTILELQSEVNNLDKIVASRKFLHESEEKQKLIDNLDSLQKDLLNKNHEITELNARVAGLQREVEKREKELNFKNGKMDDQVAEISRMQSDVIELERRNFTLREDCKTVERDNEMMIFELKKLDELQQKWPKMEDENLYLKQALRDLEDQYKLMEKKQDNAYQMNTVLEELRQAMLEKNRANDERNHLAEKLRHTESSLKEKVSEERAQQNEIEKLKNFVRDLEEENSLYRKFEREVGDMETNLRESERARNTLESQLVQLKPKIQRLQVKSLEKDHLITQLVQELKAQVGYLPSDLRKEISRNETGATKLRGQDLLDQRPIGEGDAYATGDADYNS